MSDRGRNKPSLPRASDAPAGALLALTNARRHLRAAKALADQRIRGAATSHVVFSVEELAKAWILTLSGMGIDIPKKILREVLTLHDARHAFTLGALLVAMIRSLAVRASTRVQRRHGVKDYPPELRDEWVSELRREFESLRLKSPKNEPSLAMLEWMSQANDNKNRGLYVDFDGAKWLHPADISPKQFELGYAIAYALLARLGPIIRSVHKHNLKADERLRQFIYDGLAKDASSPEEALTNLVRVALSPLTVKE